MNDATDYSGIGRESSGWVRKRLCWTEGRSAKLNLNPVRLGGNSRREKFAVQLFPWNSNLSASLEIPHPADYRCIPGLLNGRAGFVEAFEQCVCKRGSLTWRKGEGAP